MPGTVNKYGFKGNNLLLYFSLLVAVLATSYATVVLGPEKGVVVVMGLVALAVGIIAINNFVFAFYVSTLLSFFIFFIGRYLGDSMPSGYWIDLLILLSFSGLILHKVRLKEPFFYRAQHTITTIYILYTLFLVLEAFNPWMHSMAGWFLIFRKYIQFLMIYIIAINVFQDYRSTINYFKFWIGLSLIAGLYACYQQWFGFLPFEEAWIMNTPGRKGLYILVTGVSRRFSTFSDPAAFGIISAASFTFILVLLVSAEKFRTRLLLAVAGVFIILGVAFSGTRTAYFIIVAGVSLYILMTITNKRTLVFASLFVLGFLVIMFGPIYGNATINRIRSTFEFSEDASLEVRDVNRAMIQPYIYRHPIGGGLATSGIQGLEYNPGHFLAGFPPDSGFVKTAVETGWVGLLLQCLIYLIALLAGVRAFYHTEDKKVKALILASVVCCFAFVIGQYGQVAIGQFPGCFLFYSCLALIVKSKYLQAENKNP